MVTKTNIINVATCSIIRCRKSFVTQFEKKYLNELPNDVPILISQEAVEIIEYTGQTLQEDTNSN